MARKTYWERMDSANRRPHRNKWESPEDREQQARVNKRHLRYFRCKKCGHKRRRERVATHLDPANPSLGLVCELCQPPVAPS